MKKSLSFTVLFGAMSIFSLAAFGQMPASTEIAGQQKGSEFSDERIPSGGRVTDIFVFAESSICAVQMQFVLPDGRTWTSPQRGASGCHQSSFHLDSDEYVVGLSGRYDTYINSLQIRTNKRTSLLFGGSEGTQEYNIDVEVGNQGVGFVGSSGRYLNSIGLNFISLATRLAGQTIIVGGKGGSAFSDENVPRGARISEVRIRSGDMVNSIQAIYTLLDDSLMEGPVHGGDDGSLGVFSLASDEYLTGLFGQSGPSINSISIRTNKRTSQVFGGIGGNAIFDVNVPVGKETIGFEGRASNVLDAIGLNYAIFDRRERP
jgi:hypothetical protein